MNPYAKNLAGRDPLEVLSSTPDRFRRLIDALGPEGLGQSYAPGKWNVIQIVSHLAQVELAFGFRFRQTLTIDNFTVQPFDQDKWMEREPLSDGTLELNAFLGLREWNLQLFRSFSPADLDRPLSHPERGRMKLREMLETIAGHDLNHFEQLESIAAKK